MGKKVKMVPTKFITKCVDTKEDLEQVSQMMKMDKLFEIYK